MSKKLEITNAVNTIKAAEKAGEKGSFFGLAYYQNASQKTTELLTSCAKILANIPGEWLNKEAAVRAEKILLNAAARPIVFLGDNQLVKAINFAVNYAPEVLKEVA